MVGIVTHIPFPSPLLIVGALAGHDLKPQRVSPLLPHVTRHSDSHAARLASRRTTRAAHFTPLFQFPGALLILLAAPLWTGQDVIGSPRSFPRPGWSRRPVRKLMQETWEWRNGHWWTPFGQ